MFSFNYHLFLFGRGCFHICCFTCTLIHMYNIYLCLFIFYRFSNFMTRKLHGHRTKRLYFLAVHHQLNIKCLIVFNLLLFLFCNLINRFFNRCDRLFILYLLSLDTILFSLLKGTHRTTQCNHRTIHFRSQLFDFLLRLLRIFILLLICIILCRLLGSLIRFLHLIHFQIAKDVILLNVLIPDSIFIFLNLVIAVPLDHLDLILLFIIGRNNSHLERRFLILPVKENQIAGLRLVPLRSHEITHILLVRPDEFLIPLYSLCLLRKYLRSFYINVIFSCIVHTEVYECRIPVCIYIIHELSVAGVALVASVLSYFVVVLALLVADLRFRRDDKVLSPGFLPLCILILFIPFGGILNVCLLIYIAFLCVGMFFLLAGQLFFVACI